MPWLVFLWYNRSIIQVFWSKHKRILSIAAAALFLLVLFFIKHGWPFRDTEADADAGGGLTYESAAIEDLVKKDTDGDGVLDWEESLWGLDPTKPETTPGTPDSTVVNKLRVEGYAKAGTGQGNAPEENLTETEKFSRELFSTVASLNQNGALDSATVDNISSALAERVQNMPQRKVYALSDIKLTKDNSAASVKKYDNALEAVYTKYPIKGATVSIMQKFLIDEETVDSGALAELDPLVKKMDTIISEVLKVSVPDSLATLHLAALNGIERLRENLSDIRKYDTDPILALGGISNYENNVTIFGEAANNLARAISAKAGY